VFTISEASGFELVCENENENESSETSPSILKAD
jgi:hypothetical protein